MQIDSARLSAVLQGLYLAGVDPVERGSLAVKMAAAFEATSCGIQLRDPLGVVVIGATDNITARLPEYVDHYYVHDVWSARGVHRRNRGLLGEDLVSADEFSRSEWYNDFLCGAGVYHLVGAAFDFEPQAMGLIGVHRATDAPPFEAADRAMMELLIPHLRQVYRLMRQTDAQERGRRLTFEALAALSVGVFIVNANGDVRLMNSAAERIVRAGLGIRASNGRIGLADVKLDERLRAAIRAASFAPLGRSLFAGETIVVRTKDGAPLPLMISPLPPDISLHGPAEALAAVFVGDPAANLEPSLELVRAAYGLTPAETRVLFALVNGQRPADYAEVAGVSQNTVQTQLKALFAKTGCHRQADLMRKIAADPLLRLAQNLGR